MYEAQVGTSCGTGTSYLSANNVEPVTLDPSTTYFWRVRSRSKCGDWSAWSPCFSFTTSPSASAVAQLLSPADGDTCQPTELTLHWSDVASATGYEIQVGTSCGTGVLYTAAASHLQVSSLEPETTHYWRVRARNTCGQWGPWTSCASFRTGPAPLAAPQLAFPPNHETCRATSTRLSWAGVSGATGYEVQVGAGCDSGAVYTTAASYLDLYDLDLGRRYFWRVRATDRCDNRGAWSPCWDFKTRVLPPAQVTLRSPADGAELASPVTFAWDCVPGALSYTLQIGSGCFWGTRHTVAGCETTLALSEGSYYWLVWAEGECGTTGIASPCRSLLVSSCLSDGDADGGGTVTPADALCCFKAYLNGGTVTADCDVPGWGCEAAACDYDCDGNVTPADALEIFLCYLDACTPTDCGGAGPPAAPEGRGAGYALESAGASEEGGLVSVPLVMRAAPGATAFGFEVEYDPALLRFAGMVPSGAARDWAAFEALARREGVVRCGGLDPAGLPPQALRNPGEGKVRLGSLKFRLLRGGWSPGLLHVKWDARVLKSPREPGRRNTGYWLSQPSPTPSRDEVTATLKVSGGKGGLVQVWVYDVRGRVVRRLMERPLEAGEYRIRWDGRSDAGQPAGEGVYFMRMKVPGEGLTQVRKIVLIR